jgi:hypothetical protein
MLKNIADKFSQGKVDTLEILKHFFYMLLVRRNSFSPSSFGQKPDLH